VRRPLVRYSLILIGLAGLTLVASTFLHLEIPEPTGQFEVGRTSMLGIDDSREEVHTSDPGDERSVPLTVWYPAEPSDEVDPTVWAEDWDVVAPALSQLLEPLNTTRDQIGSLLLHVRENLEDKAAEQGRSEQAVWRDAAKGAQEEPEKS